VPLRSRSSHAHPSALAIGQLDTAISNILLQVITPRTRLAYQSAWSSLKFFLTNSGYQSSLPLPPEHLILYISHLVNKGLANSTILSHVAAINFVHCINSLPGPSAHALLSKAINASDEPSRKTRGNPYQLTTYTSSLTLCRLVAPLLTKF
jgi:hypothetical protein